MSKKNPGNSSRAPKKHGKGKVEQHALPQDEVRGNNADPKQPNKDDQTNGNDNLHPNAVTAASSEGMGGQGVAGDTVNLGDTEAMASPDAAVSSYLSEGGDNGTAIAVFSSDSAGYVDPDLILNQEAPAFGFVAPLSLLGGAAGAGAAAAAAALASNQNQQNGNGQNGGGQNNGNGGGQVTPPTIVLVHDDVGPIKGDVAQNGVTDDATPKVQGTAEAGATIQVYDNGTLLGSATARDDGTWSYTPGSNLPDGSHSFTAVAEDAAGNQSVPSPAYSVIVDTTPPTINISSTTTALDTGHTSTLTFTLSEPSTSFTQGSINVTGGTLSYFSGSGTTYTAIYTPDGTSTSGSVSVGSGKFSDAAGNQNTDGTDANNRVIFTQNVVPVDSAPVVASGNENDAAHTVNLLANTTDANGDTLSILGPVTFSVNGGTASTSLPTGVTLSGSTLTVDTNNPVFDPLQAGEVQTIKASYTVSDGHGGTVLQTATFTVNGINDAPVITSTNLTQSINWQTQSIAGLYNTGESNAGTALAQGSTDPHYQVISQPKGGTVTNTLMAPNSSWVANDADSAWLGSLGSGKQPMGTYTYQTSFSLAVGADPKSIVIGFDIATDDTLTDILVNGVSMGIQAATTYTALTHITLNGSSGLFHDGSNTITFVTYNHYEAGAFNPTGLRIDNMTGSVSVNMGSTLSSLLPAGTVVTDVDHGSSVKGYAITQAAADSSGHHWQYSTDNGVTWVNMDSTTAGAALFLAPTDLIRWTGAVGTDTALSVVAVDNTSTANFDTTATGRLDVTTRGGSTPYSAVEAHLGTSGVLNPVSGNDTGILGDNLTSNTTPTLVGTAEIGAKVDVTVNGKTYSTTADSTGRYSVTVPAGNALTDGSYTPSIKVTDAAGHSTTTQGTTFIIDTKAPAGTTGALNPVAGNDTGAQGDNLTSNTTPTLTGTAEAGDRVDVTVNGKTYSTTADSTGHYSVTVPEGDALSDSPYLPSIKVTDAAGNSSTTPGTPFTIDTTAPTGTTGALYPVAGNDTGLVGDNLTSDRTPTLTGTAEVGAKVEVTIGGKTYSATLDGPGHYSVTVPDSDALGDGSYTPMIKVTDAAGNSSTTPGTPFTIDATAPAAPVITSILDNVGAQTGNLASGAMADDPTPTLQGTAEANSTVTIYDGNTVIGQVVMNGNEIWTFAPTVTGFSHQFSATATDAAGNVSGHSANFIYNYNNPPVAIADQGAITIPTQAVLYYSAANGQIGKLDPTTGAETIIGNPGIAFYDIAVAPNGSLYGVTGNNLLYKIDATNGKATSIGGLGIGGDFINSLVSDQNGTLYGVSGNNGHLYSINSSSGEASQVGDFGNVASAGDLLYYNNALYLSTTDGHLLKYDLSSGSSSGSVSVVISSMPADIYGLGRYGDGVIYAIEGTGTVYSIDLGSGTIAKTGVTVAGSSIYGVASTVIDGISASITGDVTPGTADQDYDPDGNAISVTGVVAGNSTAAAGGLNTVIHGVYGNLVMQSDGTYKYTVDGTLATTQALEKTSNGVHTSQAYYTDGAGNIGLLDPVTGASHVIGNSGVGAFYDIATTPDGTLYGITNGDILYRINTSTGAATKIGGTNIYPFNSFGLVSDTNGTLYDFGSNGNIYTINKNTGEAARFGSFNVTDIVDDGIYYNNALYAATHSGQLVKYDLNTHETSIVIPSGMPVDLYGMEVAADGTVYGFRYGGEVYTFNLTTGTITDTHVNIGPIIFGTASAAVTVDASSLFGQDVFTYTITDEHGQTSTTTLTINVTDSLNTVTGGTGNDVIHNIGGGQFDQAYGQAGDDTIGIASTQFATVSGGTGTDTLAFESGNISLNLANVGSKVQGFEVFDLGSDASSTAHNSLSLRAADVLTQLSGDASSIHLEVKGESSGTVHDTVHLLATTSSSSWTQTDTQTAGGITYNVYHDNGFNNTAADVWVQQGITVIYG